MPRACAGSGASPLGYGSARDRRGVVCGVHPCGALWPRERTRRGRSGGLQGRDRRVVRG